MLCLNEVVSQFSYFHITWVNKTSAAVPKFSIFCK